MMRRHGWKLWLACAVMIPTLSLAAANVWQGKTAAWENAANWSLGAVPKGNEDIVVPAGMPNDPVMSTNAMITGSLTIEKGATLISVGNPQIKAGSLRVAEGATVLLGVAMERDRIVDVALTIEGPLAKDVCPEVTAAEIPEMTPSEVRVIENPAIGPSLPAETKLTNIAAAASIRVVPYICMARALVDRDERLSTCAIPERGTPAKGARYEFRFETAKPIARVRWSVVAGPWAIEADTDGDGSYETLLRMDLEGKLTNPGGIWRSRSWISNNFWPPVEAYGVRIISLLDRISNNRFYDVQILCPIRAYPCPSVPIRG